MPRSNALPTQAELKKLLRYEPGTGRLFWKARSKGMFGVSDSSRSAEHACNQWNSRFADKEALTKVNVGYRCGRLGYQYVLAHRVIWKLMTGEEPKEIDHIDGNRSNNKWQNLRSVTASDNRRNTRLRDDNTSGAHGVFFHRQKWVAIIYADGRQLWCGAFDSLEEAIAARKAAEVSHGYHPNHGRDASSETAAREERQYGISWDAGRGKWMAQITSGGETKNLGRFATREEAIAARKAAEEEIMARKPKPKPTKKGRKGR